MYFYVLGTHTPVFARYALPLVPVICLFAAVPIVELGALAARLSRSPALPPLVLTAASLALVTRPALQTVDWIEGLKRRDTRAIAADWMRAQLPPRSRLVVELNGPTYMTAAGFNVTRVESIKDRTPAQWVRSDAGYWIISSGDLDPYADYAKLGKLRVRGRARQSTAGPAGSDRPIERTEKGRGTLGSGSSRLKPDATRSG